MDSGKGVTFLRRHALAIVTAGLGLLAAVAPVWPASAVEPRVGWLLCCAAILELVHGLRRAGDESRRAAWFGGSITLVAGLLLINAPYIAGKALALFLAGSFLVDAIRYVVSAVRAGKGDHERLQAWLGAGGNGALVVLVFLLRDRGIDWTVALAGAFRIFGTAWNIAKTPALGVEEAGRDVARALGLADFPELAAVAETVSREEEARVRVDRAWITVLLVTLFAIHLGRMGLDRTALGILSPLVALLGDIVMALLIAFGLVIPIRLVLRKMTLGIEKKAWKWTLGNPANGAQSLLRRFVRIWVMHRFRLGVQMRRGRYSPRAALQRGLRIGLPFAAILVATIPIWGMSWYFDTENWAAGIWDSWAQARTDVWREAMIRAVTAESGQSVPSASSFRIAPPGVGDTSDFAFIVLGDPGEGDASQEVLHDRLIAVSREPGVRFLVVSSDVIYPVGAMRDYEKKFWLSMKGVSCPVYAIPGNHDWYDALDAFAATFFEPRAARTAMRARIQADLKFTVTTDEYVEELIREADRLRGEYRVSTGYQDAPFFQLQTSDFALFALDTGVRKRLDDQQMRWFEQALEAAEGKFVMVILGHPLYAVGEYMAAENPDFAAIHALLKKHAVPLVMAGDTHDLEYYRETDGDGRPPMHHFVNGGGGAYLSLGTALAPPERMPTRDWAFYPATDPIVAKIQLRNPVWKKPVWWWTRRFDGWPFSAEWLSAAFDYNVAPFFQSFFEVRVERSAHCVRLIPHGVHGRLLWSDIQHSAGLLPADVSPDSPAEWILPMEQGGIRPRQ